MKKEEAKLEALKKLRDKAHKEMGDSSMGVSIKSDSKEGLLAGLEKARKIVKKKELPEKECEMSQDDIKEKIAALQEMLEE